MDNKVTPQIYGDPSKVNFAGAEQADLDEYQKSLEEQVKALEMRYQNPNWFKVAAGFLKPQLGGFSASLGSAAEALGENIEAGRAAQLPVAQMRAQLAASKIAMGQNKKVADMVAEHAGKPLTPEFVAEVTRIAPTAPSTLALQAQLKTQMEQQGLSTTQQGQALQILKGKFDSGAIGQKEYAAGLRQLEKSTILGNQAPSTQSSNIGQPRQPDQTAIDATQAQNAIAVPNAGQSQTSEAGVGMEGLRGEDVLRFQIEAAAGREKPYADALNDIIAQTTHTRGHSFIDQQKSLETMNMLYNGAKYKRDNKGSIIYNANGSPEIQIDDSLKLDKAFDALRDKGLKGAFLNAVKNGLALHTPVGSYTLSAPVITILSSLNLNPEAQTRLLEFSRRLAEDRMIQSNISSLRNEKEFNTAMSSITPEAFDPGKNVNSYIIKRLAQIKHGQNVSDAWNEWRKKNNTNPNVSDFWHSKEHKDLLKSYESNLGRSGEDLL
jgi:hypothetical protein